MDKALANFLNMYNFSLHRDINIVLDALLYDMHQGLLGNYAWEDMIHTYCNPPTKNVTDSSVIVIDAGGTNFRSCLVTFDSEGKASIEFMEKTKMPGVEKELSKKEFFDQFATNLEHLKDKASRIGFCFSYPMKITEDGDGILIGFSKEIKAPEVVGCHIGQELIAALKEHGWKNEMHVSLLNDTVAALLAGASISGNGKRYSSYIGFILGTGMNGAYIQPEVPEYDDLKQQIIVCESGKFCSVPVSTFDLSYDTKSVKPGTSLLEKQCSGAYLGPLSLEMIQLLANSGLFSYQFSKKLLDIKSLSLIEMDAFLHKPYSTDSILGSLAAEYATEKDYNRLYQTLDAVVERSANLAAAILAACAIKSGKGFNASEPICMLCNGTTFYKTWRIQQRVEACLQKVLTEQRGIYYEIVSLENDITLGTAIGGLI